MQPDLKRPVLFQGMRAVAELSCRQVFDGNLFQVMGEYAMRFLQFLMLVLIWRSLAQEGADLGAMTLPKLLTYTLMASVLRQQLDIITPATSATLGRLHYRTLYTAHAGDGKPDCRNGRKMVATGILPIRFAPLDTLAFARYFSLAQSALHGLLAFVSLALSASLGFALDFLFASLAMRLKNGCWAATQVREALFALLSGALIPFALLPPVLASVLELLPMGSIAHAPLSIYVGEGNPVSLLLIQAVWNLILWPLAMRIFRKSEERMISYGG